MCRDYGDFLCWQLCIYSKGSTQLPTGRSNAHLTGYQGCWLYVTQALMCWEQSGKRILQYKHNKRFLLLEKRLESPVNLTFILSCVVRLPNDLCLEVWECCLLTCMVSGCSQPFPLLPWHSPCSSTSPATQQQTFQGRSATPLPAGGKGDQIQNVLKPSFEHLYLYNPLLLTFRIRHFCRNVLLFLIHRKRWALSHCCWHCLLK